MTNLTQAQATRSSAPSRATGRTSGRGNASADLQEQLASVDAELLQAGSTHQARRDELVARKDSIEAALRVEAQEQAMIAAGEYGERLLGLTRALVGDQEVRLAAIQRAEACVRMLAVELGKSFAASERMTRNAYDILKAVRPDDKGWSVPAELNSRELERRLAQRLSAVMATLRAPVGRGRLGYIEWRAGMYTAEQSWRDQEEAASAEAVASLIETARSQF
jgi:hypothetical protein